MGSTFAGWALSAQAVTPRYLDTARLLARIAPAIFHDDTFALKGGTAINLFVRDMPRLSVDLDLTYLPIEDRDSTLANIALALHSVQARGQAKFVTIHVAENLDHAKLVCARQGAQIKIEVS